jgi:hypothetical protein
MPSMFPSCRSIHFMIHLMATCIVNGTVKQLMQNIIGAVMRVSFAPLQFVRKLKVKGEQHIMRSVPFHSIIPIYSSCYANSVFFGLLFFY